MRAMMVVPSVESIAEEIIVIVPNDAVVPTEDATQAITASTRSSKAQV